jgi:hypothetical protein
MNQGNLISGKLTIGLDRELAQRQFIEKAEDLGIPPVTWEKKPPIYDPPKCLEWDQKSLDPVGLLTDGKSKSLCPISKKLLARAPETNSLGTEVETTSLQGSFGSLSIWPGLLVLSGLVEGLWPTLGSILTRASPNGKKRRLHARAWNKIGV